MKEYIIKEGGHYSNHLPKPYLGLKKDFGILTKFYDSCRYNLNNSNQDDINKLFGISFGYHQQDSIRIGWNYDIITGKIKLFWYIYNDGIRKSSYFSNVAIDDLRLTKLTLLNDSFIIQDNYNVVRVPFEYPAIKLGYYLYPYFGGDEAAPHDIKLGMDIV